MPYINIRVGTELSQAQQMALQTEITELMASIMGKRREVTLVQIESSAASAWSVDGRSLSAQTPIPAYVDIKITQGTNTSEHKAEMLARCMALLQQTVGVMQEACYIVIDEIPADAWGYNGLSQQARALAKSA